MGAENPTHSGAWAVAYWATAKPPFLVLSNMVNMARHFIRCRLLLVRLVSPLLSIFQKGGPVRRGGTKCLVTNWNSSTRVSIGSWKTNSSKIELKKINENHFGLHRVSHVATRLALGFEYECAYLSTDGVKIIGHQNLHLYLLQNHILLP